MELLINATDMVRSFPIYQVIWRGSNLYGAFDNILKTPALQGPLAAMLTPRFVEFLKQADPA